MHTEAQTIDDEKNVGGMTASYAQADGVQMKVPYSFFGSIYDEKEPEALRLAMKQDTLTMGPQVAKFQENFAAMCGVKHAYAVSSCTTAMHLCTQLMEIGEGDEVIVTPNTFIATSLVILKEKATPVYADIDPRTFDIDPNEIKKKITNKTKAIYVVHYGGQMCDMDAIMELARHHGLHVLEDCAHAHGAEYQGRRAGSFGDVGCFSFHSLKNMNTGGEGGMVTTNRSEWHKPISMLRCMNLTDWDAHQKEWKFGSHRLAKKDKEYWIPSHFDVDDVFRHWGNNYRMNEIQAAIGLAQLEKLEMLNEKRRQIGRALTAGIKGIRGITPPYEAPERKHVYHLYTLCVEEEELGASRDEFLRVLYYEEGIQGILHYQPTYHFTGLKKLGLCVERNHCPNAEKFFYKRELNLPMHPRLTERDIETMVKAVQSAASKVRR